jgi:phage-related protein
MKPVEWVGSSYKDFRAFPDPVQDEMGFALYQAQIGGKPADTKPLKGFGGAGILEIVADHKGDAYRAVYTVWFSQAIYVLHAFQKKSRKGIKTQPDDIELIRRRLAVAEMDYTRRQGAIS